MVRFIIGFLFGFILAWAYFKTNFFKYMWGFFELENPKKTKLLNDKQEVNKWI